MLIKSMELCQNPCWKFLTLILKLHKVFYFYCSIKIETLITIFVFFCYNSCFQITVMPVVPPIVLGMAKNPMVLNYDLSSVKKVLSGAAPLGKELEDAFRARVPDAIIGQVSVNKILHKSQF